MESQREVERQYEKLMRDVKTKDFYTRINMENRINCYQCSCGKVTKTKDVDPGVTPFMHKCECGELSRSTFYNDIRPHEQPTEEWYRPTLKYCLSQRNNPGLLDHIFNGGLMNRKIKVDNSGKSIEEIIYQMSSAGASKKEIDIAVADVKIKREHGN